MSTNLSYVVLIHPYHGFKGTISQPMTFTRAVSIQHKLDTSSTVIGVKNAQYFNDYRHFEF